jgi:hypothetical protein
MISRTRRSNHEKRNEPNFQEAGSRQIEAFSPKKPKHTYLYAYISMYLYPVHPVNPVKKIILQNEAISEGRRRFQLRVNQSPPPADSSLFPFPLYLYTCLPNEAKFSPLRSRSAKEFVTLCRKIAYRLDTAWQVRFLYCPARWSEIYCLGLFGKDGTIQP